MSSKPLDIISVIVPKNPFPPGNEKNPLSRCLCALNVETQLMKWWPGTPHRPELHAENVRAIQRSLDWKRVAEIAAYLLQDDLKNVARDVERHFSSIYSPKKNDPGREWPPKNIPKVVKHQHSEYPEFGDILVHINGARPLKKRVGNTEVAYHLEIDPRDKNFRFTVIDGQHRINGAYLALKILQARKPNKKIEMELAATAYLDLDAIDGPARHQAQLFIDVNYNQKKVDRSLVFDLFPTTWIRGPRNDPERAQDLARRLMLEIGPLVGMVQIPGIKYGVKGVVTLATLAGAIQGVLEFLDGAKIRELKHQAEFLAQLLSSWLEATGWKENEDAVTKGEVDPEGVVYQGRVLVSVIALTPAAILLLRQQKVGLVSEEAARILAKWANGIIHRAKLERGGKFVDRKRFRKEGFLGSGGIGRFRDLLWAATDSNFKRSGVTSEEIENLSKLQRGATYKTLPPSSQ